MYKSRLKKKFYQVTTIMLTISILNSCAKTVGPNDVTVLFGDIVDASTGEPISGCYLNCHLSCHSNSVLGWVEESTILAYNETDGSFEWKLSLNNSPHPNDGCDESFTIRKPGYEPASIYISRGGIAENHIELVQSSFVHVTVKNLLPSSTSDTFSCKVTQNGTYYLPTGYLEFGNAYNMDTTAIIQVIPNRMHAFSWKYESNGETFYDSSEETYYESGDTVYFNITF